MLGRPQHGMLRRHDEAQRVATVLRANPDSGERYIRLGWWVFPIPLPALRRHAELVDSNKSYLEAPCDRVSTPLLADTPWSVRHARGTSGQPALEIYEAGDLIGVMVAHTLAPQLLRGARRASRAGHTFSLAWGRLPADGSAMTVTFGDGWRHGRASRRRHGGPTRPELTDLADWCWLAVAAGQYGAVRVATRATSERLPFRPGGCR